MGESERSIKDLVRSGWDRASLAYRPESSDPDSFGHRFEDYRAWLDPLLAKPPRDARALDLGCGCGVPVSALLAHRFDVTGVDISRVQIDRARKLVPNARFVQEDMARIAFDPASFEAVVAFYSLIHVPLQEQRPMLSRIHDWLTSRGWLIVTTGHDAYEGVEEDWLGTGAAMYWSHADASTYRNWLRELGFEVVDQRFVPEGPSGHELFWARAA